MKKKFILFPLVAMLLYVILMSNAAGPGTVSATDATGASGTAGCSCHNASATTSTTVSVQLLSGATPVTAYVPGASYTIRLTGTNTSASSLPKFGFQVSARTTSSNAGVMTAPASTHTVSVGGVTVVEHNLKLSPATGTGGTGTTYVVNIPWNAPATAGAGTVTLRGVVNPVNDNTFADAGDLWNNAAVTVNELGPITGTLSVCTGSTTALAHSTTGGTWFSSTTANATVNSTGVVTGVAAGTSTISYTVGGNIVTAVVTVNTTPTVTGSLSVCQTLTTTLTPTPTGGTWASSDGSIATVGTGGVVTGVAGGTAAITYTTTSGCEKVSIVTVSPYAPITGGASVCMGGSLALSDANTGGTWSSSNTGVATINSSTGLVAPVAAGTTTISYIKAGSCTATQVVTVNALPSVFPISGGGAYCAGTGGVNICLCAGSNIGTTYNLYNGATLAATVAGTGSGVSFGTFTASGTYTAVATSAGCTQPMSGSVSVSINPVPAAISGLPTVCLGGTTMLNTTSIGGSWVSSNPSVALIGSSSGVVTGTNVGTSTISYVLSTTGCYTTTVVSVNAAPTAITGTLGVCIGLSSALASTPSGGTWSSSNANVTVDPSTGVITGAVAGSSIITYTLGTGCMVTAIATANALPVISGPANVCNGSSTTYSSTPLGGTWSATPSSVAAIGSTTGVLTAIGPGTVVIVDYAPNGCTSSLTVTVNTPPSAISGVMVLCANTTTSLSSTPTGGTWSSSAPGIASAGSSSGVITGVAPGTANITYTSPVGCVTTSVVTINAAPAAITGLTSVCQGLTIALSTTSGGVIWSSGNPTVASVNASGIVTGLNVGTATITCYFASTGCAVTTVVTVNPLPSSFSGSLVVCTGLTTTLVSTPTTGIWSSSNTGIATVGFASGIVTGVAPGTSNITYTLSTGCLRSEQVTVNAAPAPIVGPSSVCVGSSVTLANATPGGTWSISSAATISATGVVTGSTAGTALVTYTLASGCISTYVMTINPLPAAIGGLASVCVGSTTTLNNGTSGGTWMSSTPGVATVGSANGLVSGASAGTTNITYMLITTGCSASTTVTVNALPTTISGTATVCPTTTTVLASTPAGGTWSSSNISVATAGLATGIITGVVAGTANITYTTPGTFCTATRVVTVNAAPTAGAISGTTSICTGTSSTMTNPTSGGTWSVSNSNASISTIGVVTGLSVGSVVVTYTTTNSCGSAFTTHTINITNTAATGPFGGATSYCPGGSGTVTNAVTGGVWESSNTAVATIGSMTGLVAALIPGTTTITYTITTVCGTAFDMIEVTVNPLPSSSTGVMTVCVGSTTALSNTGGGTWASGNTGIAAADAATGVVTGVSAGTANITYTLPTGCTTTSVVTVNPLPLAITGALAICESGTTTLANATPSGTWSSASTVAIIGSSTGIATGVASGTTAISYTALGCTRTAILTVNPLPSSIGGNLAVCVGSSQTLTNLVTGGTWTSSTTSVATIGVGSGVITGINPGTSNITYTLPTGCRTSTTATVNPVPAGITGSGNSCVGATNTLSDATPGGTWISSDPSIATVGSSDGAVTGVTVGTVIITYQLTSTTCFATKVVTVNAAPTPITGGTSVCLASTSALGSTPTGGTWSSSNTSTVPVIFSTGVVVGAAVGTATITYTAPSGCKAMTDVTVNALPPAIVGPFSVCMGLTTTLTNTEIGGTWTAGSTAVATIGSTDGVVTGIAPGTTTVTYTALTGCSIMTAMTVNNVPAAIAGLSAVCEGATISLTNASFGGTWSSSATSVAGVGSITGVVTGVAAGTTTVSYVLFATGCYSTKSVTVNPIPLPITGTMTVCAGATTTLTGTPIGGVWSGTVTGTASINPLSGVVSTVAAGTATVSYTLTTGCYRTATVSVNAMPDAGSVTGVSIVCESATITLLPTVPGGTWSVTNTHASVGATGMVNGISMGVDTVIYTVTNSCGTDVATMEVTVDPLPAAGVISGSANVCVGVITTFASTATGGMWSSGAPAHVMIAGAAGTASGGSPGADTVFYTVTNSCGFARSHYLVTVLPHAVAGTIAGGDTLCINGSVHLTTSEAGGAWSAVNTKVSVVGGHVTGTAAGTSTVLYVISNACSADTVNHNLVVLSQNECATWLDVKQTVASAYELKVYPNPSDGSFTVDVPEANSVLITITDMAGRVIESKLVENNAQHVIFNLNNVSAGNYMVRVDANGASYRTKVVILE